MEFWPRLREPVTHITGSESRDKPNHAAPGNALLSSTSSKQRELPSPVAPTLKALIRHIVVGGLWHPVKRRAEHELISELAQGRYSSFPFISPDTFRALCDVVIEGTEVIRRPSMAIRTLIFFDLSEIEGTESSFDDTSSLKLLARELDDSNEPPVVIMSHGDLVPSRDLLSEIARRAAMVFSINLTEETDRIRAIPLGLENMSRNINGRLGDYFQHQGDPERSPRTRDVFTAFEPDNNPTVRGPLVEILRESRFGWNSRRMLPDRYREAVKESLFVLSPPGRGLDCHRTWEAIYLGAVPVVLEGSLPATLSRTLPIHVVPDYREFLELNHDAMLEVYRDEKGKTPVRAFAPYWIAEIMNAAHA